MTANFRGSGWSFVKSIVRTLEGLEFRINRQHLLKLKSPISDVNEPVRVKNGNSLIVSNCPQNPRLIQSQFPQFSIPTRVVTLVEDRLLNFEDSLLMKV